MICRMCVLDSKESLDIFSSGNSKYNIPSTIAKHFWFEPRHDDLISSRICNDCWRKIESFHTYYLSVEEAHRELSNQLQVKQDPELNSRHTDANIEVKVEGWSPKDANEGSEITFIDVNEQNMGEQSNAYDDGMSFLKLEMQEEDKEVILNDQEKPNIEEQNNLKHPIAEPRKIKCLPSRGVKRNSKYLETPKNTEELVKIETIDESLFNDDTSDDSDNEPLSQMIQKRKRCKTTEKPQVKNKSNNTKTKQAGKYSSEEYLKKIKEDDLKITQHMKLKCDICSEEYQTFIEIKAHYRDVHSKRGYVVCCNKRLYKRVFLVDHVNRHINPEYFKCDECNKTFADKQCMQLHMIRHQSEETKMFPCEQCPRRFAKQYMLEQHKLSHIPEEEREHICKDCGKAFPTHGRLQTHRKYVHERLYGHMCHICAKVISGKEQFAKHQLEHAGVPIPKEECPICGAMLKTKQYLRKHLRLHTEADMEHKCKICGKVSPSRGALRSHIHYKHSSNRSFKCSVCDKAFKKAIVLKEHMTTHTGEVLYTCPHCPKTFNSHANMHAHIKRVHRQEWEEGRKNRSRIYENVTPSENDTSTTANEIYESPINNVNIGTPYEYVG